MSTVLVIEDEQALREEIIAMLSFEGFNVLEAINGETGIQLAREHHPDIVVCDISMPVLDGYQVLEALQTDQATVSIPFIFLTARVTKHDIRAGMALGADDYLTKPFTPDELIGAIRGRLTRQAAILKAGTEDLERARENLVRLVTHELRTPVISITTVSEIISRKIGNLSVQQTKQLLDDLVYGSQRLTHLIDQMVFLTQLEAGYLTVEAIHRNGQHMPITDIITASINKARQSAPKNNSISIRVDSRDYDVMALCDPPALKHAYVELIKNALTFAPDNSEILVNQWSANGYIWVSILDQGVGIPTEQLEKVLLQFHQVNRLHHEQQGLGLGLSLAYRLFQAHSGNLEIDSVIGKGTQVTTSLPLDV